MIIALFPNVTKSQSKNIAIGIKEFLVKEGVQLVVEDEIAHEFDADKLSTVDPKKIDYMISLGGDGTILRLFHRHPKITAPILGINLGSLGFLADIPVSEIYPSLQELLEKKATVKEQMVMQGESLKGEECFAVNDIAIHRAQNPSIVDLAIHVDGNYLNTFSADGIIIATPCGSTAYSLSAGGPIITHGIDALALTPICPHTISNRPIILMPKKEIQIQLVSNCEPVEISHDGHSNLKLASSEVFTLTVSNERKFRQVLLSRHDEFLTLRTKLAWSGKLRT